MVTMPLSGLLYYRRTLAKDLRARGRRRIG
jgi:hypothetical protein